MAAGYADQHFVAGRLHYIGVYYSSEDTRLDLGRCLLVWFALANYLYSRSRAAEATEQRSRLLRANTVIYLGFALLVLDLIFTRSLAK
jgi:hypothetical protein